MGIKNAASSVACPLEKRERLVLLYQKHIAQHPIRHISDNMRGAHESMLDKQATIDCMMHKPHRQKDHKKAAHNKGVFNR